MRTGRARALRPLAMAIVAERALYLAAIRSAMRLGALSRDLPPAETKRRAMVRGSSMYGPRVVKPAVRRYKRERAWRPWWLS